MLCTPESLDYAADKSTGLSPAVFPALSESHSPGMNQVKYRGDLTGCSLVVCIWDISAFNDP